VVTRSTTTWRTFAGLTRLATNSQTVFLDRDRGRIHPRMAVYHRSRFHRCSRCSKGLRRRLILRRMIGDT
jgi:hypothetical protein